jgi:predicted DCC family thiol-disulfide oxidoreductase YuxK
VAFAIAPFMTNRFFLKKSQAYSDFHKISLIVLLTGTILNLNYLAVIWPLFCAVGFFLYLKSDYRAVFSAEGIARCIPFIFSLISSIWFVAGVYDLHLLGYSQVWSFYAALHGAFLGWMYVGCLAFLSKKPEPNCSYLWSCYLCLVFFLCVAFGIDGTPYIKRIGVLGLSVMVPFMIGHYLFNLKKDQKLSFALSALSLISILLSMTLAVLNEFWSDFPKVVFGFPSMVIAHGFLNAAVVVPCFFLAIAFERLAPTHYKTANGHVIFFDDLCVLCSGTVFLLLKIDRNKKLKYSSLHGKFAKEILNLPHANSFKSVVFLSEGLIYERGAAVIHILMRLGGVYKMVGIALKIFPIFILNLGYDLVARNRYRVFGKNEACLLPTDDIKELFIP